MATIIGKAGMKYVNVKSVVGREVTPEQDGRRLGQYLVENLDSVASVTLDVMELAPEDLVSSFTNAVIQSFEKAGRGAEVEEFRSVHWRAKYDSERARLEMAVNAYLDIREEGMLQQA